MSNLGESAYFSEEEYGVGVNFYFEGVEYFQQLDSDGEIDSDCFLLTEESGCNDAEDEDGRIYDAILLWLESKEGEEEWYKFFLETVFGSSNWKCKDELFGASINNYSVERWVCGDRYAVVDAYCGDIDIKATPIFFDSEYDFNKWIEDIHGSDDKHLHFGDANLVLRALDCFETDTADQEYSNSLN